MAEYIVIRPWFGVKAGQRVEIKKLTKAFAPNVRLASAFHLEPAAGEDVDSQVLVDPLALAADQNSGGFGGPTEFDWEVVRLDLVSELDDAGIEYDDNASAAELAALLPVEVAEGIKMSAE